MEGKSQSAGEAVRISVQLSVGGAAWGLAVGVAATLWLRFMFESIHAEITLTVSPCSLCCRALQLHFAVDPEARIQHSDKPISACRLWRHSAHTLWRTSCWKCRACWRSWPWAPGWPPRATTASARMSRSRCAKSGAPPDDVGMPNHCQHAVREAVRFE